MMEKCNGEVAIFWFVGEICTGYKKYAWAAYYDIYSNMNFRLMNLPISSFDSDFCNENSIFNKIQNSIKNKRLRLTRWSKKYINF